MAKKDLNVISLDGVDYVRKDSIEALEPARQKDGLDFVLVRTKSAGVYFGWLSEEEGDEVVLVDARNVWYWSGAASLLQMANDGVANKESCKFTQSVSEIKLKGVVAVLPCTRKAQDNLTSVKVWEE